jgi:uncharacterized protein YndB with AHSA1/START domain
MVVIRMETSLATRKHVHEEILPAAPERVFALLHTPSAIRNWWSVARAVVLPQSSGIWAAAWGENEDASDYVFAAVITAFDPPRLMVLGEQGYHSKDGPLPFRADFVTKFEVESHPQGALLRVTQDGFPTEAVADAFYAGCAKGWQDTFEGIRRYLKG